MIRCGGVRSRREGEVPLRFFNTTGPVDAADHYCLPPLARLDAARLLELVAAKRYFVLHAPRQTGKTSALFALRDLLNDSGEYRCVYVNVEVGQSAREDVDAAMRAILAQLSREAQSTVGDGSLADLMDGALDVAGPHGALGEVLSRWSAAGPRPLVLLVDEIDALIGDTLVSVLRQLRAGYPRRPGGFPQSLVLCGVRDVRDYRIHGSSSPEMTTGGSAFNIKAASLRLGDFDAHEVRELLTQHTDETGQAFTDEAHEAVWRQTRGQPWLVNALAYEACFVDKAGRDRSRLVTTEAIMAAQEQLIVRRETHLDQLAFRLREDRVRRVVEPLLSGGESTHTIRPDDIEYARDLGLLARSGPAEIANPIYREVIPRELVHGEEAMIPQRTSWYVRDDGTLDLDGLLAAFQSFFREHSEHWVERFDYKEAGPQLLLQAFLHRVVNGGGRIEREYGLGRGRTDLLILWPDGVFVSGAVGERGEAGRPVEATMTRHVVECKVRHKTLERTVAEGLEQTAAYMDRCDAEAGHLVVFDRTPEVPWDDKVFCRQESFDGKAITVWGM